MATKHPYLSGVGAIHQSINHLRKSFPNELTSETLKKLGIAKNNESAIISILKFIKVLDEKGIKTEQATKTFVLHNDDDFKTQFAVLIREAYSELFDLYKEDAWTLDSNKLISFFRQSDQSSLNVGRYQTGTFQALSTIAGYLDSNIAKNSKAKTIQTKVPTNATKENVLKNKLPMEGKKIKQPEGNTDIGLTVRVEINLPANADKETYDSIFKSIRENLIEIK